MRVLLRRFRAVWIVALLWGAGVADARAEMLVAALSTSMVTITSNFSGTDITVFGSIETDGAEPAGGWNVAVALVGPRRAVVVRRKERVAGLWINRDRRAYHDVPAFYALASTLPIDMIATPEEASRLRLGFAHLRLGGQADAEVEGAERSTDFRDAVIALRRRQGLFAEYPTSVAFLGRHLFATTIPIPAEVPIGHYEAQVTLFAGKQEVAERTIDLLVVKSGFEQAVADMASRRPALYGLLSVAIALFTGWLGGVLFRRD